MSCNIRGGLQCTSRWSTTLKTKTTRWIVNAVSNAAWYRVLFVMCPHVLKNQPKTTARPQNGPPATPTCRPQTNLATVHPELKRSRSWTGAMEHCLFRLQVCLAAIPGRVPLSFWRFASHQRPRLFKRSPRFINGIYLGGGVGLFLRTPFTEGCNGVNYPTFSPCGFFLSLVFSFFLNKYLYTHIICTVSTTSFSLVQH